jgi:hypothetical protein
MAHQREEPVEDFLEVDQQIPGQNFVCLSFISPEKVLKRRESLLVKEFAKWFLKDLKKMNDPSKLDPAKLTPEFIDTLNVDDKFEDFLYANEEEITRKFNDSNDFQTSIRGLKVRGVYESKREAEVRAKVLQRRDPNFHVFVGQVGYWLPWDPNPDGVAEQEYSNDQLNTLMKKYQENRKYRDDVYANETEERKKAAREENQKRKFYQPKTDEEMKEAEDKIRELRDIVNEKDRLYSKIEEAAAGKAPEAAATAAPEGNGADAVDLPVSGGGESVEAVGLLSGLDDGQHADPWMQRRQMASQGRNFVAGNAEREPTVEERDKMLSSIVKDIF